MKAAGPGLNFLWPPKLGGCASKGRGTGIQEFVEACDLCALVSGVEIGDIRLKAGTPRV